MRITTNTNDTATATATVSAKLDFARKNATAIRRIADNLNVEQYVAPDGDRKGALKLKGKLGKWAEVDAERSEAHAAAVIELDHAVASLQAVAEHLESLPEGYNPGAPKKARGSKFEVGAPVAVKESKLEEYAGLIEDPRCLKVVEVRKTVILIETTDGVRFPIAKAALEVIA